MLANLHLNTALYLYYLLNCNKITILMIIRITVQIIIQIQIILICDVSHLVNACIKRSMRHSLKDSFLNF